jgi:deazaflavin-dependent oxidoreductase (nitroreductase family)
MINPSSLFGRAVRRLGSSRFGRLVLGPKMLTRIDAFLHRVTGGKAMAADLLFDTLMLTTTGRKSGEPRTNPLARMDLDGTPVVIASNFGRDSHPAWSLNLLADPNAIIEEKGVSRPVVARQLTDEERERVWPQAVAIWPGYDTYRKTTEGIRDIRMFALEPRD